MRDMTRLSTNGLYKIADLPAEIAGVPTTDIPIDMLNNLRAFWNHAERYPSKGEWYLKGTAELKAYRATENLKVKYPIAGLAITESTRERRIVRLLTK